MKNIKIISIVSFVAILLFATACTKDKQVAKDLTGNLVGTYQGTFTDANKSSSPATATITRVADNELQIHCFGALLDTTITQRLFEDGQMVRMCDEGDAFQNQYGHAMMNQSSHHDMMSDSNGLSWAHHMSEEHSSTDEHFGSFDTSSHSFSYSFNKTVNGVVSKTDFSGTK